MLVHSARLAVIGAVLLGLTSAAGFVGAEEAAGGPLGFVHESSDAPELARLRALFDFDEVVSETGEEMEMMFLLKDWVFRQIDFRVNFEYADLRNALSILGRAQQGIGFHCSHLAAVYMQTGLAMGWTPRYLFMRNTAAEEHASNEIWSNQWQKWVFVDVTWNLHVEKDGIPLSALDIREEWLRNAGQDIVYVFGAGTEATRYTAADFPIGRNDNNAWRWWPIDELFIAYTYELAYVTRNDFFSQGDGSGSQIWDAIVVLKDAVNETDETWAFRNRPSVTDVRALYPDVNRVDLMSQVEDESKIVLTLDKEGPYNITPNFQDYLVQIGNDPWRAQVDPVVTLSGWDRRKSVRARIRNQFGVLGPVTTVKAR